MKWNRFRLKTTTEAEDIVSSMLADLGVEGVQIEDKIPLTAADKEQMFVDILPETEADDGIAYLSFYLDSEMDKSEMDELLANVKRELEEMSEFMDLGECTIEESQTEDIDWVNNWKQYFHQFYVDDILIIPSWEEVKPEDSDKMVDPYRSGNCVRYGNARDDTALHPSDPQTCYAGDEDPGCGMRQWNFGNAGAEVRRGLFGRNGSGSMCHRCDA